MPDRDRCVSAHGRRFPAASTDETLEALAASLARDRSAVVLTGAGVSSGSDIPTFREPGGLWDRYDPMAYATIGAFREDPVRVWEMLRELDAVLEAAEPNAAHRAIAALEGLGVVDAVVTQNVDGLHADAGSGEIIELHGSRQRLVCLDCGTTVDRAEIAAEVSAGEVPSCPSCAAVLKPDVTFFGEELPSGAMARAERAVSACDHLLVVGTSAEVEPAASLPRVAAARGATVWEIDPEPSLPRARAIALPAEEVLPTLVEHVRDRLARDPFRWLRRLLPEAWG